MASTLWLSSSSWFRSTPPPPPVSSFQSQLHLPAALETFFDRFGYALPLLAVVVLYLVVRYPDSCIGTHGKRSGVHCVPGWPLIGNLPSVVRFGTGSQFHRFLATHRESPEPTFSWSFPPHGRIVMVARPQYVE